MAHNGGRIQLGLNFMQLSCSYPFLNFLKTAQRWFYVDNSNFPVYSQLNSTGYPTTITNGGVKTVFYVPAASQNYVCKWTGGGSGASIYFPYTVSGSKTGNSGRFTFVAGNGSTPSTLSFGIDGNDGTMSKLIVCREADEAACDRGEAQLAQLAAGSITVSQLIGDDIFGVKFLEILRAIRPSTLRFLDWLVLNRTNVSLWSHRRPVDHIFYDGVEQRASLWGGTTTNTGDDYLLAFAPAQSPVHGATVLFNFNTASTGYTPTLNGIAIKNFSGDILSSSFNDKPITGGWAAVYYDSILGCWIKDGGGTAESFALMNGAPPELCIALCNTVGSHLYTTVPKFAIEPETDYMQSFAVMARDNLSSGLKFKTEGGPNECWNTIFPAPNFAENRANTRWGVSGSHYNSWYGMACSVIGKTVHDVFSGDTSRYEVICGCWGASFYPTTNSNNNPRMSAAEYVAEGGGHQAASAYVTHGCIPNYFAGSPTLQQQLDWGYEYTAGGTTTQRKQDLADLIASTINASFSVIHTRLNNFISWLAGYGTFGVQLYEGGYEPTIATSDTTATITGITKAASAVVTISGGIYPPVGSTVSFASVAGMTEINGGSGVVSSYSTGAGTVTVALNSSAYSTYTSGGVMTFTSSMTNRNAVWRASKRATTLVASCQLLYQQIRFLCGSATEPSQFLLASDAAIQQWGALDPDIYDANSPTYDAMVHFNNTTRPYRMTVTTG